MTIRINDNTRCVQFLLSSCSRSVSFFHTLILLFYSFLIFLSYFIHFLPCVIFLPSFFSLSSYPLFSLFSSSSFLLFYSSFIPISFFLSNDITSFVGEGSKNSTTLDRTNVVAERRSSCHFAAYYARIRFGPVSAAIVPSSRGRR